MSENTGKKSFNTLQQVYVDTGLPTGVTKDNDPGDPDYIAPVTDLENCAPPEPPDVDVNTIRIQIFNNTTQSISFQNFIVKGESSSLGDSYYNQTNVNFVPGSSVTVQDKLQIDLLTRLKFNPIGVSLGIRVNMIVRYQRQSDFTYTTIANVNFVQDEAIDLVALATPLDTGTAVNTFKIYLTDNPVTPTPDNILPSVEAGVNQSIYTPASSVVLSGSTVDSDGSIASVLWTQDSGPVTATIVVPNNVNTNVTGLTVTGTYIFKLTAIDNAGGVNYDTVKIIVTNPINPNGVVNILVDPEMPDGTYTIDQITLTPYNGDDAIELLSSPLDKTSGVTIKEPLKGTYKITVKVTGTIANDKSLRIVWAHGTEIRWINLPEAEEYTFENVVVDEGADGVIITFFNVITDSPTSTIVYARIEEESPTTISENVLPNGLIVTEQGLVAIKFYTTNDGLTGVAFTGVVNYQKEQTDVLTSDVTDADFELPVTASEEEDIDEVQEITVYDYDVSIDPQEHLSFDWSILKGEGYLKLI